tara:strand:- start:1345 stop:1527 length:183 start_codon:yes stop_codon:yes gene_type:complete
MLVLARKKGQKIVIDGPATITITRIQGNTVKIGIKAADEVAVVRGELELHPPDPDDKEAA